MKIDAIILSNTKDLYYYGMTCRTINSLKKSDIHNMINIMVVETQKEEDFKGNGFVYYGCKVIHPNENFNYNKYLNIGIRESKNDWILICNNDLIFSKNWLPNMMDAIKNKPEILSFSPISPILPIHERLKETDVVVGYQVGNHICGWCILLNRCIIEECELFDEQFEFWCQDDDYAEELKEHNILHGLVPSSKVYHVGNCSHTLLKERFNDLTNNQQQKFFKKWNQSQNLA